jgi:hypothetical protein
MSVRRSPIHRSRFRIALALLTVAVASCDIPTQAPKWDTEWVVPADSVRVEVDSLLPASVRTTTTGGVTAFQLALGDVSFGRTLGQICSACTALNGTVAPKPAFTATFSGSVQLPSQVLSVALLDGGVAVTLTNNLGFDPLRPSANASAARGTLTVAAKSGATTLTSTTIDGATTAFPNGTSLSRTLTLATATVAAPIDVVITVTSPAGDPVTINTSNSLSVLAHPASVRISSAQVAIASKHVTAVEDTIDLSGLDSSMANRVQSGALRLHVSNPFTVQGAFSVTVRTATTTIQKSVTVAQGESDVRVELSAAEIQSIAGQHDVRIGIVGDVSTPSGSATFTPGQHLTLRGSLEVVIRVPEA